MNAPRFGLLLVVGWLTVALTACHRPAAEAPRGAWTVQWWTDFREPGPWKVVQGPGAIASYTPIGYRLAGVLPGEQVWSLHPTPYRQVRLAAHLRADPTPYPDGLYGLVCGYQDPQHFVVFALDTHGAYQVRQRTPQGWRTLAPSTAATTSGYRAPQANRMMVECRDTGLRLWVNDRLIYTTTTPARPGQVGLWLRTPRTAAAASWGVTVHDLTLWTWQRP